MNQKRKKEKDTTFFDYKQLVVMSEITLKKKKQEVNV